MATLNTAFKQIFGEGLKEHGFVKVKGRHPYFARVVGDGEIIHVIAIKNEWCGEKGYKAFSIIGTVITVYRDSFDLSKSPSQNINIFYNLSSFYSDINRLHYDNAYRAKLIKFTYKLEEKAMKATLWEAFEETQKVMLPVLDQTNTLEACIQFYEVFGKILMIAPTYDFQSGKFERGGCEGFLYIKTNNHDDFIEESKRQCEERIAMLESVNAQFSPEIIRRDYIEEREERVQTRDAIYNNPVIYERALEELKRRKVRNTELLRGYGLDV